MESQSTQGVVPIHHQIADALRALITSGELLPGDSLPTVAQLADEWRCTPITVKTAFGVLRSEGLITSGRGKAATVREQPERQPIRLTATWSQAMKDLALKPLPERKANGAIELTQGISIEDVDSRHRYDNATASVDLAAEFGVPEGSALLRRTYEMANRRTGYLLTWSVSYIPRQLIEGNPRLLNDSEEPWPGGHLHQLYTMGIEVDQFERTVTAKPPTPADRQRWGIDTGVPMLWVRSRSIDTNGRVVELSDAAYPADRTEISLVEQLDRWPADHPAYDPSER